jgi:hypothetical protein
LHSYKTFSRKKLSLLNSYGAPFTKGLNDIFRS